jgi:hypothetical protein
MHPFEALFNAAEKERIKMPPKNDAFRLRAAKEAKGEALYAKGYALVEEIKELWEYEQRRVRGGRSYYYH